ncbi:MAG: peptidylprolyl isomerase [Candidatus Liberibacter europaeus]|nr:peptidylprolyl isomerase [Candidatus Liberibacter europaeus]
MINFMMEIIRKASRNWVAKIFLVLLIVPFVMWGLSGIFFPSTGSKTVISVGKKKIPFDLFLQNFHKEFITLSKQSGSNISLEEALSMGLAQRVINFLIVGSAIDQFNEDIGFKTSLKQVFDIIKMQPMFYDKDGKYNHDMFLQKLDENGINEKEWIDGYSKMIANTNLISMIFEGLHNPKLLVDQVKQSFFEKRDIDYVVIDEKDISSFDNASEKVIKEWFERFKQDYRAPEYRSISYVLLNVADEANKIVISDSDLRAEYEKRKDQYLVQETRKYEQLFFANEKEANISLQSLKKGKTFEQLANEKGQSFSDISVGTFSKLDIPDPKLAGPVFAVAKNGGYTDVVKGSYGFVIARVSNIKPSFIKSFDDVKQTLQKEIRYLRARQIIEDNVVKQEQIISSGKSIEDIAKSENLNIVNIPPLSNLGEDMQGRKVGTDIVHKIVLPFSFSRKDDFVGRSQAIKLPDGSYVWVTLREIIPSRDRKLDEVRSKVEKDWKIAKYKELLSIKATKLVDEYRKKNSFQGIGIALKRKVLSKHGIGRLAINDSDISQHEFLGENGLLSIFSVPVGTVGSFPIESGKKYVVFKIKKSQIVSNKDKQFQAFLDQYESLLKANILDEFSTAIKNNYSIHVNEEMIQRYFDGSMQHIK